MQKKKFIITLLFAVLSIFMITACSDSGNESNNSGNNGAGGTYIPQTGYIDFYPIQEKKWSVGPFNFTIKTNNKLYVDGEEITQFTGHFDTYLAEIYDEQYENSYYSLFALTEDGLYSWGNNEYAQLGVGDTDNRSIPEKILDEKVKEIIQVNTGTLIEYGLNTKNYTKPTFFALTETGNLYVWGYKYSRIFPADTTMYITSPEKINIDNKKIKEIQIKNIEDTQSGGYKIDNHLIVYMVTEDNKLYSWGYNDNGELGIGNNNNQTSPVQIPLNGNVKELIIDNTAYSHLNAYIITEDNKLYGWGYNNNGELGIGNNNNQTIPVEISLNGNINELIIDRSLRYALMVDNSVHKWGGSIGNTPVAGTKLPNNIKQKEKDYFILEDNTLWDYRNERSIGTIKEINEEYILMENGELYKLNLDKIEFPENTSGVKSLQIYNYDYNYEPEPDPYYNSYYAVMNDGSLYAWGYNYNGLLGVGDDYRIYTPAKVDGITGNIKELIFNKYRVYALTEDGALYAWGSNRYGQLGIGSENENETLKTPNKVNLPGNIKELITASSVYDNLPVYALMEDGSLYAWGYNPHGELGVGDEVNRNTPAKVDGITGNIIKLYINSSDSTYGAVYIFTEDGAVYASGHLAGTGSVNTNIPTKLNLPSQPKKMFFRGCDETFAVMEDDSIYVWGSGYQFGLGGSQSILTPAKHIISGNIKEFIDYLGDTSSTIYVIMEDDTIYGWGDNKDGQLGLGDNIKSSLYPVLIKITNNTY